MDVSVVIPAFNAAHTIAASIASIKAAQKQYSIEIIVVDDSSTDATWQTLLQLKESTPELVVIKNSRKKGPSGARNSGLDLAQGEFIAFLDADDVWYENHLELGLNFLNGAPQVDLILFNQDIKNRGDDVKRKTWFEEKDILSSLNRQELAENYFIFNDVMSEALLKESFLHLQSFIGRKKSVSGVRFDENVFRAEDMDFGIQLYAAGCKFSYSMLVTGVYYRGGDSLTSESCENQVKTKKDVIYLLEKYYNEKKYSIGKDLIECQLAGYHLGLVYPYRKLGLYRESFWSIKKSMSYSGFTMRHVIECAKVTFALLLFAIVKKHK